MRLTGQTRGRMLRDATQGDLHLAEGQPVLVDDAAVTVSGSWVWVRPERGDAGPEWTGASRWGHAMSVELGTDVELEGDEQ